ncbi:conserved membrane protein of unknown function [Ruminococcaceae bacterium BL-6]|nr:conserved membrane protein of unknown function [Ruminococcaceae bacterium BL-6]
MNQEGRKKWYGVVIFVILWYVLNTILYVLEFSQRISLPPYFLLIISVVIFVLVIPYMYYLHKKYPELTQKELRKDKKLWGLTWIFVLLVFLDMILARIPT